MPVQVVNLTSPTNGPDGVQQCHDVRVFINEAWDAPNRRVRFTSGEACDVSPVPTTVTGATLQGNCFVEDVPGAGFTLGFGTGANTVSLEASDGATFFVEDDVTAPAFADYWWDVDTWAAPTTASSRTKGAPNAPFVEAVVNTGQLSNAVPNQGEVTATGATRVDLTWNRETPGQTKDDVTLTSDDPGSTVTELDPANGIWEVCRTDSDATHNTTLTATNDVDAATANAPADFVFGAGGVGGGNPNNVTCHSDDPDAIQHTQARMCMTADNVAPGDFLVVEYATSAGGPYTVQSAGEAGDNTVGQQHCNIFTGLTPNTTYFFRGTVHTGAANGPVVSEGPECSLTTSTDPHYVSDACTGNNAQNVSPVQRDTVAAQIQMTRQPIVEDFTMLVEESVNGSPFAPIPPGAMYRELNGTAETANPLPVPNAQTVRWYMTHRYEPGDEVQFRYTGYLDGVATNDVCVTNEMTTADVPDLDCFVDSVTETSANVGLRITNGGGVNVEPWGGHFDTRGPNPPDDPDNVDDIVFRYGTTPGGPYPNAVTVQPGDSFSDVTATLPGLTDDTTYYFRVDVEDKPDGLIAFSNECSFTTTNDPTNDGPEPPTVSVTPQPCVQETDGGDPAAPSTSTDDECLTDDNGVFFRRTSNDGAGNVTVTNVDVAGAPYTPVGTVNPCSPAQQAAVEDDEFFAQPMCSNGNTFLRIFRVDDGGPGGTPQVTHVRDVDDDGSPFVPPGPVTIGACGTTSDPDEVDAQAVALGPNQAWTPGGNVNGTLLSVSLTVVTGTAQVVDSDGTPIGPLPEGSTLAWSVNEDENTLNGPQSITAQGGAAGATTLVAWTER